MLKANLRQLQYNSGRTSARTSSIFAEISKRTMRSLSTISGFTQTTVALGCSTLILIINNIQEVKYQRTRSFGTISIRHRMVPMEAASCPTSKHLVSLEQVIGETTASKLRCRKSKYSSIREVNMTTKWPCMA